MKRSESRLDRRTVLALASGFITTGLAGCGGNGASTPTATPTEEVPGQYRTATSLNGQERDPTALSGQAAVEYQSEPSGEKQCSNCAFYVPDQNDDGLGACSIVAGPIEPEGYCVSYSPSETGTPTGTTGAAAKPVAVPQDAECPVCGMKAAMYPDWNAQLRHEDGARVYVDTAGCMVAYYVLPEQFAETDTAIDGVWVTDYETRELIDGREALYALETDSDRVDDPMGLNPAPFESRENAEAYVDAVEYLSRDDVVEIGAFDHDLATRYRGNMIEEN